MERLDLIPDRDTTKIYIGTSGWHYDSWKGSFYPEDLPKSEWLEYYASKFNSLEINATFYRYFQDTTFINWAAGVPAGFKYVLKMPRLITHIKKLKGCGELIKEFERSSLLLDDKFGMILMQLAPKTAPDLKLLKETINSFEGPERIAVEFREDSWINDQVVGLFGDANAVICRIDSPKMKPHMHVTGKRAYIRLHGRQKMYAHDYTEEELREIASMINELEKKSVQEIYVFFNNDHNGYAPKNAMRLKEILEKERVGAV